MRVVERIASGGCGVVDLVEDETGQKWAQKTFFPDSVDPAEIEKLKRRFINEVRIASHFDHPNLIKITASFLNEDPPRFLMPLADGHYRTTIDEERRVGGRINLRPLLDILAGLEELHRVDLVHRDLKPENVLRFGESWAITDYGLVRPPKSQTTRLTGTHSTYGTVAYSAPEQTTNFRFTPSQADIYAFGCILHDLVVGKPRVPYQTYDAPGALGEVIRTCTHGDPESRYPDIQTLREALVESAVDPLPPSSVPVVNEWLESLRTTPETLSVRDWQAIAEHVDRADGRGDAELLLRAIDSKHLHLVRDLGIALFDQLSDVVCSWATNGTFEFEFCDVIGSRLRTVYEIGKVGQQSQATMAVLRMGSRHSRWYVMRLFMQFAGGGINVNLADRLLIEFQARGKSAALDVRDIELTLHRRRDELHPKLSTYLQSVLPSLPTVKNDLSRSFE